MSRAQKLLITIPEMAQLLSIGRSQAYCLASSHTFYPAIRIGEKSIRINVEALKQWVSDQSKINNSV